jgi:integrase
LARSVRDTKLENRTNRLALEWRRAPYWRMCDEGLHLGYRRVKAGNGSWVARRLDEGRYFESALGPADDYADADGATVLSFFQAQDRAREWHRQEKLRALGVPDERKGPYRVSDAISDYEADFIRRGGKALVTIKSISATHILPALGNVEVSKLSTDKIRRWHHSLASGAKIIRSKAGATERATKDFDRDDPEAVRRRRSTANRALTVLRAALNFAFAEGKAPSDDAWRRVKSFKSVDAARVRYLTADECARLVNTCAPDFRELVRGGLLTGCRYGELTRLRCDDVNLEAGTIHVRESKSGKPRHVPLTDEGVELFRRLTIGRERQALVFMRDALERQPRQERAPSTRKAAVEMTAELVAAIRARRLEGVLVAEIAAEFGMTRRTVSSHTRDLATKALVVAALKRRNADPAFQARARVAREAQAPAENGRPPLPLPAAPEAVSEAVESYREPRTIRRGWKASEPTRFLRAACGAARINPPVSFHELRHSYASLLASAGVPLAFVAEVLGHSDSRITQKHYAHLSPSHLAAAIRQNLPRISDDSPSNVAPIR